MEIVEAALGVDRIRERRGSGRRAGRQVDRYGMLSTRHVEAHGQAATNLPVIADRSMPARLLIGAR